MAIIKETLDYRHCVPLFKKKNQNIYGSGGIRTHASEETGALNQRLRPLGHATLLQIEAKIFGQIVFAFPCDK